jgi:hypothetical protein
MEGRSPPPLGTPPQVTGSYGDWYMAPKAAPSLWCAAAAALFLYSVPMPRYLPLFWGGGAPLPFGIVLPAASMWMQRGDVLM